jgi:hypothetical protein
VSVTASSARLFFKGLGEGASRVEHVSVDFLDDPANISKRLEDVRKVDHIFFFSYVQPAQKGIYWACGRTLKIWLKSIVSNDIIRAKFETR